MFRRAVIKIQFVLYLYHRRNEKTLLLWRVPINHQRVCVCARVCVTV